MERVRCLVPEPQVAEQAVKAVQLETRQSIGQANEWQFSELDRMPQGRPPCFTSVMMERDLVLEPVPQVLVHAPYADQAERTQLLAHPKVLQAVEEVAEGQDAPPF